MKDLLTNIKKAIEILNKTKNLTISLTDPEAMIYDEVPVGVSRAEWELSVKEQIRDLLFTADNLYISFDCTFDYDDLRAIEGPNTRYQEAMQRIIKEIFERYKWAKSIGEVSSVSSGQPITGSKTYGSWSLGSSTTMQSGFSNLQVVGGLNVSSELDDLKKRNDALKDRLELLEDILRQKGVL